MALSLQIVDASTQAVYPGAYGRIDSNILTNSPTSVPFNSVTLNWYVSSTAAGAGAMPIRSEAIPLPMTVLLTPNPSFVSALLAAVQGGKISSPLDALTTSLYLLIKQTTYPLATDA